MACSRFECGPSAEGAALFRELSQKDKLAGLGLPDYYDPLTQTIVDQVRGQAVVVPDHLVKDVVADSVL